MASETRSDPTKGLFGNITRRLNAPEMGISEFFGGQGGSVLERDIETETGGEIQGPRTETGQLFTGGTQPLSETGFSSGLLSGTSGGGAGGGGGEDLGEVTGSFDVGGTTLKTTDTGNILGLSDLKKTQGFIDFAANNEGATGQDYLEYLDDESARRSDEVDSVFGEASGFLDEQEALLRGAKPELLALAANPFEQALPQIQAAAEQGRGQFAQGVSQAQQTGRGLLSDAQRLANELQQRNRQVFGGAQLSSAAQAAGELLGRQTAQGFGDIRQNTANAVQNLERGLIDFNNEIETRVQQVELQRQQALSEAELAFRDSLSQINNTRFELEQQKAAAQLEVLREYRTQVANIQAQEQAFRQQVELLRQQGQADAQSQLDYILRAVDLTGQDINTRNEQLALEGADISGLLTTRNQVETPGISGLSGFVGDRREEDSIFNVPNIERTAGSVASPLLGGLLG